MASCKDERSGQVRAKLSAFSPLITSITEVGLEYLEMLVPM